MSLFALQKTVAYLAMPAGLLWLFLWGACALCFRRRQRGPAWAFLGAALCYGAVGNVHLGTALMARLERAIPPPAVAALEPFDAVCVLGAGSDQDPFGGVQLSSAGDRIFVAARLWHEGKARLLVASGYGRDSVRGPRDGGQETRQLWQGMGVPDSAILVVPEPCWNTRDEIAAYRRLQQRLGWRRMALVSSASHLPRALILARRAGLAMTPVGADWQGRRVAFQLQTLVPQMDGFDRVQRASWELLGGWLAK